MLYSPWNSPGQNTGVGSRTLLQGIFPTQGLNPGLPHCMQSLYQLATRETHRGQAAISFMPDTDGMHVYIFEGSQLEGLYVQK